MLEDGHATRDKNFALTAPLRHYVAVIGNLMTTILHDQSEARSINPESSVFLRLGDGRLSYQELRPILRASSRLA